jgi:hypothetical protein
MIAVPALLFYFLLVLLTLFAALASAVLFFAVALFWNLHRLSKMALLGVDEARDKLSYVWTLFTLTSGL